MTASEDEIAKHFAAAASAISGSGGSGGDEGSGSGSNKETPQAVQIVRSHLPLVANSVTPVTPPTMDPPSSNTFAPGLWKGAAPAAAAQPPRSQTPSSWNTAYSMRLYVGRDRVLVVHFNPSSTSNVSAADQLVAIGRVAIPAICNYLYFRASKVAVIYFGKTRRMDGTKVGVDGGEAVKQKLLKFMISEIWPPLRADVPDDSMPADTSPSGARATALRARQSAMQALVYRKAAKTGATSYVKVVLSSIDKLHFDITEQRDEKNRWENRKLHIRMLDNLETQKAIFSYEEYEAAFREACRYSLENVALEPHARVSVPVKWVTSPAKYTFFQQLKKPESATLDYKSYFSNPMREILEKGTKFMCGFFNAYGHGKLIIGVHELKEKEKESSSFILGTSPDRPDAPDQVVVGIALTRQEIEEVATTLGEQLCQCLPPVSPRAVHIDVYPVALPPSSLTFPMPVLVLYETGGNWRDSFRQKSNHAIRVLCHHGYSLCPIVETGDLKKYVPAEAVASEFFAILSTGQVAATPLLSPASPNDESSNPTLTPRGTAKRRGLREEREVCEKEGRPQWWCDLHAALQYSGKMKSSHVIAEVQSLKLPELVVVELSADISRMASSSKYPGKYFNGWPTIPIWDTTSHQVAQLERDYEIFASKKPIVPTEEMWWNNESVVPRVVEYLRAGGTTADLSLRLVNTTFRCATDQQEGFELVQMLKQRHLGVGAPRCGHESLRQMQHQLGFSGASLIPLIYAWVYEQLGSLPSPFPYLAVPLAMQCQRVSSELVPLYFSTPCRNVNAVTTLHSAIVFDTTDGHIKTVVLTANGNVSLQKVTGVGFEPLSEGTFASAPRTPQKPAATRRRIAQTPATLQKTYAPPLRFHFHARDEGLGDIPWTMRNLLLWLELVTHDPHVVSAGYCGRCFVYELDPQSDTVCNEHTCAARPAPSPTSTQSSVFAAHFDCCLHRAEFEWAQWEAEAGK